MRYLYGFIYHLKPYKISDGIHCFFGLPSQVSHINGGNMVNSIIYMFILQKKILSLQATLCLTIGLYL